MKNDEGFTLVELVVVLIIVVIITGVTIAGLSQYVNASRVNTDLSNASSLEKELTSVLGTARVIQANAYWFMSDNIEPENTFPDINNGNLVMVYHWAGSSKLDKYKGSYWFIDKNGDKQKRADWGAYNAKKYHDHKICGSIVLKALYDAGVAKNLPDCQSGGEMVMLIYFDNRGNFVRCKVLPVSNLCNSQCIRWSKSKGCWRVSNFKYYINKFKP